jgi:hypothetical protein
MGSANPLKQRDYGNKTRIDLNQSYQVAYWKERFGVSEAELRGAMLLVGPLAKNVEEHLRSKDPLTLDRLGVQETRDAVPGSHACSSPDS